MLELVSINFLVDKKYIFDILLVMDKKTTSFHIDGEDYTLYDYPHKKKVRSENYNYNFNKGTGRFQRWGKIEEDNPLFAPSLELLDIEVTTSCSGINGKICDFCYKSNTPNGKNMSLETFKNIIDKIPIFLTQIAIGADSRAESNPDLFSMMEYSRSKGIIPNITVADISDSVADKLSKLCGGVSVSRYQDKNVCYNSVEKLTNRGLKQTNIHLLASEETYDQCIETINDIQEDPRLEKLNAIVFLSLKKKGRGTKYTTLSYDKFKSLVDLCLEKKITFGTDSCFAPKFLNTIKGHEHYKYFSTRVEACEAYCFSGFVNVEGKFFPCSFAENMCGDYGDWKEGIDLTKDIDFFKDIWFSEKVVSWRNLLLSNKDVSGCRKCQIFDV